MTIRILFNRLVDLLGAAVFTVITVVSFAQIIMRYVFHSSFVFADELAVQLMIWIAFLGAAKCVSIDAHTRLTVLVNRMPPTGRIGMTLLSNLLSLGFLAAATWYGFKLVHTTWRATTIGTHVPEGLVYLAMPLCGIIMMVFLLANSVDALRGRTFVEETAEEFAE